MKDILVDQTGEFRCPKCKGKNFQHKRTLKAKAGLGIIVLPGALLAPKRMKCLGCGTYSKTDGAERWVDPAFERPPAIPPPPMPPPMPPPIVQTVTLTDTSGCIVEAVTARSSSSAVVAAQLLLIAPSLSLAERTALAARLIGGEAIPVARVAPADATAIVEQMRAVGIELRVHGLPGEQ